MKHRITLSTNLLVVLAASKNRNASRQGPPKEDGFKVQKNEDLPQELVWFSTQETEESELLFARA